MGWGLLRTLFFILLGYYVIRWIARFQARKQYREEQSITTRDSEKKSQDTKNMNTDSIGEYVDYEEVK